MLWLQKGDQLPVVAWAQKILNGTAQSGAKLKVDGVYGEGTKKFVEAFQSRKTLRPDGVLGPTTWNHLKNFTTDQIVNFVGDGDAVFQDKRNKSRRGACEGVALSITAMGGDLIVPVKNQDAQSQIIRELKRRTRDGRKIGLLRLYGHGRRGHQNLSTGRGGYYDYAGGHWSYKYMRFVPTKNKYGKIISGRKVGIGYGSRGGVALSAGYESKGKMRAGDPVSIIEALSFMSQLKPFFAPLGTLELHGCCVAMGVQGRSFVQGLASTGTIPITAAIRRNKVAYKNSKLVLRVESPRFIAYPLKLDLASWAILLG